ncbi:cytochrome P450 [Ramlibacter alkalitolerans]|uniref:Cytochrome P450 n=1 Tax=Ramlibacter alkalitolerans TaxID=2039631 RepID=A0ABS1JKV1_9BURK|nr:cytochrome P450 [Ramlibacter alkalitolerans]MBL0424811.1 cytochrome P450 [Ramlibacter alkalitolerans]
MDAVVPLRRIADLPAPPGLPLMGNAHQIHLPEFHQNLEGWQSRFGDFYRVRVWGREFVVVADPQVVTEALRDRPGTFQRTDRMTSIAEELHFGGLFASNGDKWRRQRTMVMAAFDPGHVKRYFPALAQVAQRLAKRFARAGALGEPVPVQQDLMRFTVDVIAGLAFGADIDTLGNEQDPIQQHMDQIFPMVARRLLAPVPYWRWFKLPRDRRLDAHLQALDAAVAGFIAAARERLQADPALRASPSNLIEAMLAAREQPGNALTDQDVAANVVTMLLAGEDTTANTLSWMLWLLCRDAGALRRAGEEVRAALGDERVPTCYEQMEHLPFVEACAHETMRLKPVAPLLPQQAARDTVLAGVAIPKGTMCIFLMRPGATDARYFEAPESFRPERWLGAEAGPGKRVAMPFGAGPRICPGRYLALLEIKVAMATVLGSFELEAVESATPEATREHLAFTMAPTPLRMRLRPRD